MAEGLEKLIIIVQVLLEATQHHSCIFIYLFIFCFLGPHLQYMEVPSLGVKSKLQLPAYAIATATLQVVAMPDP